MLYSATVINVDILIIIIIQLKKLSNFPAIYIKQMARIFVKFTLFDIFGRKFVLLLRQSFLALTFTIDDDELMYAEDFSSIVNNRALKDASERY